MDSRIWSTQISTISRENAVSAIVSFSTCAFFPYSFHRTKRERDHTISRRNGYCFLPHVTKILCFSSYFFLFFFGIIIFTVECDINNTIRYRHSWGIRLDLPVEEGERFQSRAAITGVIMTVTLVTLVRRTGYSTLSQWLSPDCLADKLYVLFNRLLIDECNAPSAFIKFDGEK